MCQRFGQFEGSLKMPQNDQIFWDKSVEMKIYPKIRQVFGTRLRTIKHEHVGTLLRALGCMRGGVWCLLCLLCSALPCSASSASSAKLRESYLAFVPSSQVVHIYIYYIYILCQCIAFFLELWCFSIWDDKSRSGRIWWLDGGPALSLAMTWAGEKGEREGLWLQRTGWGLCKRLQAKEKAKASDAKGLAALHGARNVSEEKWSFVCQTKDEIVKFINGVIEPETETLLGSLKSASASPWKVQSGAVLLLSSHGESLEPLTSHVARPGVHSTRTRRIPRRWAKSL